MGQWEHGPHGPVLPGPRGCTYPPCPTWWAIGVTGSWGASSLHSEAPSAPPAGPAVNGSLCCSDCGRGVRGWGQSSPSALLLWGKSCTNGSGRLRSPGLRPVLADEVEGKGPASANLIWLSGWWRFRSGPGEGLPPLLPFGGGGGGLGMKLKASAPCLAT